MPGFIKNRTKKFSGILFCTDIDGTLTDFQGRLSDENCRSIKYFQENGGLFTVATGRRAAHLEQYRTLFWPTTYLITLNGSVIAHPDGEAFKELPLGPEAVGAVGKMTEEYPFLKEIHFHMPHRSARYDGSGYEVFKKQLDEPVYDVVFCQTASETLRLKRELPQKFPRFSFSRSWPNGIEMYSKSAGKGNAVALIKQLTNSDISIATGNYDNDVDMLLSADISYVTSDAYYDDGVLLTDARNAAKKMTVSCDESAIAHIIHSL